MNLNGGSFVGYPDPENAGAGDRPVEKRPFPERRYFVKFSVILLGHLRGRNRPNASRTVLVRGKSTKGGKGRDNLFIS
jgi:hypothetical protein